MVRFWLCFKYKPTGFADGSDVGGGGKREIKENTAGFGPSHKKRRGCHCLRGDSREAGLRSLCDFPAGRSKRHLDIGGWSLGEKSRPGV